MTETIILLTLLTLTIFVAVVVWVVHFYCCCFYCVYIKSSYMMSLEGFLNKCLVPADAGHRPNLAVYGHCRDRPRPLDPHEMAHGPGGPVDTSVRELAGATTGRRTRQFLGSILSDIR